MEERQAKRQKKQNRNRKVKNVILLLLVLIIAVVAGFFLWNGVIHRGGPKPAQVEGVKAKTCYSGMDITWDQAGRAAGYYIYASRGDEEPERIAEVTGGENCRFSIDEYTHDEDYNISVSAYGVNTLTKQTREGERSEPIIARYDSDKYARKIPILAYHKIVPAGTEFSDGLVIDEAYFDEQMAYLHDNGFKTLTLDEFYQWHAGKLEVPPKSCMVTFDDGFYGVYYLAYPIIKKYDQAATLFCIGKNTDGVTDPFHGSGEKNYYVKQDVIEKVRKEYPRFEFESHTFDMHNRVHGKKPAVSFSYEQIMEDCEKNAQFGFRYLAYPWGTYSETMQKALKDSGYKMAFAYRPFYYAKRTDDIYAVNRIKISGKGSMENFIRTVNGENEKYDAPEEE